jgi:F0F1-type ATP synthase membrane subunit b/b'
MVTSIGGTLVPLFGALIATTAAALAEAAEGSHASSAHHGPSLFLLWINFALYLGLFFALLRRPLLSQWKLRRERIRSAVERSAKLLEEAQSVYEAAMRDHSALESVLEVARQELISSANCEAQEMISMARDRADRLLRQASHLAEAERNRRLEVLRQEFARRVIDRAETIVRQSYTEESDRQLRSVAILNGQFLARLGD